MEGYLTLTFQSLTLMNQGLNWSSNLNRIESIFLIITMIVCCSAPMAITWYFIKNFTHYREKQFLRRFRSVIRDFNYRFKWNSVFVSLFCYRRLVMSLLIVFLPSYPFAQVQLITQSSAFVIIIYGYSNVYQT